MKTKMNFLKRSWWNSPLIESDQPNSLSANVRYAESVAVENLLLSKKVKSLETTIKSLNAIVEHQNDQISEYKSKFN